MFTSKDLCAASALLKNSSIEVFSVMETGAETKNWEPSYQTKQARSRFNG